MNKLFKSIFNVMMLTCLSHSVYGYDLSNPAELQEAVKLVGGINNPIKLSGARKDILGPQKDRTETLAQAIMGGVNKINSENNRQVGLKKGFLATRTKQASDRTTTLSGYRTVLVGSRIDTLIAKLSELVNDAQLCVPADKKNDGKKLVDELTTLNDQLQGKIKK